MLRFFQAGGSSLAFLFLLLPSWAGAATPSSTLVDCGLLLSGKAAKELLEWEFARDLLRSEVKAEELNPKTVSDKLTGTIGALEKQGAVVRPVRLTRRLTFSSRRLDPEGQLDPAASRDATARWWHQIRYGQSKVVQRMFFPRKGVLDAGRFEVESFSSPISQDEERLEGPERKRRGTSELNRPEFPEYTVRWTGDVAEVTELPKRFPESLKEKFAALRAKGFVFAASSELKVPWYTMATTPLARDLDPASAPGLILIRAEILGLDVGFLSAGSMAREIQHALDSVTATEEFFAHLPRVSNDVLDSIARFKAARTEADRLNYDLSSVRSMEAVASTVLDLRAGWSALSQYFTLEEAIGILFSKQAWKEFPSILSQAMRLVGSHLKLGFHLLNLVRLKRTVGTKKVPTGKEILPGVREYTEVPVRVWSVDEWLYYAKYLGMGYACRQDVTLTTNGMTYQVYHPRVDSPNDGSE